MLDYAVDILLQRKEPGSKTQVGLHFGAVRELVSATSPTDLELLARAHIADRLSRETFQKPDDIATAFATVGIGKIWSTVFGNDAHSTKQQLSLIVNRRNRIVHSCDVNPLNSSEVMPLADSDALTAADSITEIVTTIDTNLDANRFAN
ncbi:hypothetical protein [Amycolatopsis sp. GM8]|uniref:hypothetical protein n=1 Tax=Amycolatopsis sp. GM8 TaxID=2896530 RepID=UPI001F42F1F0|nr:hypothetical protein [Amycolatopsis sp. GM8]